MKRIGLTLLLALPPGMGVAQTAPPAAWTEPLTGLVFVALPKGCFQMGSSQPQEPQPDPFWERIGYPKDITSDERPQHEACLDAFSIGRTEVTAAAWHKLMGGPRPRDGQRPAVGVRWADAVRFAELLTARAKDGARYRLPTEAEWEYACRAGGSDINPLGEGAAGMAWHRTKKNEVQPVALLKANAWGLYDLLGNAWEWTLDAYQPDGYRRHALYNPRIDAPDAAERVLRGGSIRTEKVQTRCAMRGHVPADFQTDATGFRLVREK